MVSKSTLQKQNKIKKPLLAILEVISGPYVVTKCLLVQLNKGHVTRQIRHFVYLQLRRKMQNSCLRNAPLSPFIFCPFILASEDVVTTHFYLSLF